LKQKTRISIPAKIGAIHLSIKQGFVIIVVIMKYRMTDTKEGLS
jgi:hypothetical protein